MDRLELALDLAALAFVSRVAVGIVPIDGGKMVFPFDQVFCWHA